MLEIQLPGRVFITLSGFLSEKGSFKAGQDNRNSSLVLGKG